MLQPFSVGFCGRRTLIGVTLQTLCIPEHSLLNLTGSDPMIARSGTGVLDVYYNATQLRDEEPERAFEDLDYCQEPVDAVPGYYEVEAEIRVIQERKAEIASP